MNKTIYFFNENHSYGGGEKMFMWLSKKLFREGYDVRYCMLFKNDDIDTSPIPTDYLDFKFFNSYLLRNLWYFLIGSFKIFNYVRKNNVKYVVCFGFNSFYILGFLRLVKCINLLASERADPSKKRFSFIRKLLFTKCNGSVFQTETAKNFYYKGSNEHCYIIPNPVIIPKESWVDNDKTYNIIAVGRIDFEQKRQDFLVKAFKSVIQTIPKASLTIVGTGYDKDLLENLIKENGLENHVKLVGFKKDVLSELKRANIYVLSSDFEGIPNSLLEAMAYGMPVISTNFSPEGAAAFVIKDQINGLIVQKDNMQALSDAIIRLLNDNKMRQILGGNARESMRRFDADIIIKQWERAIEESFNLSNDNKNT